MPEGWLAKWLDHWSMRQTLLKASPAGTLLFQRSRLSLVCSVSPLGSLELSSQIRRKAVLGLRSSLGRKTLPRIQKV